MQGSDWKNATNTAPTATLPCTRKHLEVIVLANASLGKEKLGVVSWDATPLLEC